ncbi:MAG: exosortase system-associated protein, TIGR04073 family [Chlamydiota bacterium]
MRTMATLVSVMMAAVLVAGSHAWADQAKVETADSATRNASGKFGRGLVNVTTGWGELIKCPREIKRDRGMLLGVTWGPLKGVAMTVVRTTVGVLETGLFFYPLPGNYDPMLQPEFIWPGDCFIRDRSAAAPPVAP